MPKRPATTVAFLVRVPARLHERAKDAAWRRRTSLNAFVTEALEAHLAAKAWLAVRRQPRTGGSR